ncbi:MAG: SpvB/TcaC N-terminal domain-containing protein [Chloroflexota bacterium]
MSALSASSLLRKLGLSLLHAVLILSMLLPGWRPAPVQAAAPESPAPAPLAEASVQAVSQPVQAAPTPQPLPPEDLETSPQAAEEFAAALAAEILAGAAQEGLLRLQALGPARPGENLMLAWGLDPAQKPKNLELHLQLPPAFTPAPGQEGNFDPVSGRLRLPLDASQGLLTLAVAAEAQGPFDLQASLVQSALLSSAKTLAELSLSIPEDGLSRLPASGGAAQGLGGRVRVRFPAQAGGLAVRIRPPLAAHTPPFSLSGAPFEIVARSQADQVEVRHFEQPLSIEVAYDAEQFAGQEANLRLYYYDEARRDWQMLPTQVDTANQRLTATSDHLTVFDISTTSWEESRLPSLQAFQVSAFSGAANYSLPLWTPPGPGGLAPSLNLSYNSQASDNAILGQTQASWVGMGWSLETGYIERYMYNTEDILEDDTFVISAAGVESQLRQYHHQNQDYYYTPDAGFWRIYYDEDTDVWTAWDKSGTQYIFGLVSNDRAIYPFDRIDDCDDIGQEPLTTYATWRWSLSKIRNIYGQEVTFSSFRDQQQKKHKCWTPQVPFYEYYTRHIYPETVSYANGQYQVYFEREARSDYSTRWIDEHAENFYQSYRLKAVHVRNQGQDVRRYDFTYAPAAQSIYPDYLWSGGGPTLTLWKVEEVGLNGDDSLPETIFSYDQLHLSQGENGYGGAVQFTYDAAPWYELENHRLKRSYIPRGCVDYGLPGHPDWRPMMQLYNPGPRDYIGCRSQGDLLLAGQATRVIPSTLLQPGAGYRLSVKVRGDSRTVSTVRLGLVADGQIYAEEYSSISSIATITLVTRQALPASARSGALYLYCSSACRVNAIEIFQLTSRYRVLEQRVYDGVEAAPSVFQYRYDEPATNDSLHSASAYTPPVPDPEIPFYPLPPNLIYSEFRGHAAVEQIGPDGRVNTTYFYQDDDRRGRASASLVTTQEFQDDFTNGSLNPSAWEGCDGGAPVVARLRGDPALKLPGATTWRGAQRLNSSLTDGDFALAQFQLSGTTSSEAKLALESGSYRWGVYFKPDGSLQAEYTDGSGAHQAALLGQTSFARDAWYVALLAVDDDGQFLMRLWKRDDPAALSFYRQAMPANQTWRLKFSFKDSAASGGGHEPYQGGAWLDGYSEGRLYSLSEQLYSVVTDPLSNLPWARLDHATSLNFEGDAEWVGRRASYTYGDYGNRTRSLEAAWDAGLNQWRDYRLALTGYSPNDGAPYLVGLPGIHNRYACPANSFDGACSSSYPGFLPDSLLLSSSWNLYDGQTLYSQAPITGSLTAQRTLLRFAGANYSEPRYLDQAYTYDEWGNPLTSTVYNSEGSYAQLALEHAQTITSTYDTTYHAYALAQTNDLGHTFSYTYDYNLGLPTSLTGPNGPDTSVTVSYDNFGRPVDIVRPGDSAQYPTMQFSYHDSLAPYWIELRQRIEEQEYATFRRYYDGLGQMIQAQTPGTVLDTGVYTVTVDTWYNDYGQVVQQSVPYTETLQAGFQPRNASRASSHTAYDVLGRTATQTAPDGTFASFAYFDLETRLTDPGGNATRTLYDVWGRTAQVIPLNGVNVNNPLNPQIAYSYDALDRLEQVVNSGLYTTSLEYDYAGRKTSMEDPDMGTWYYAYDAVGNLVRQTDARQQRICLYYDELNRLRGKHYRTDDLCPGTPAYRCLEPSRVLRESC